MTYIIIYFNIYYKHTHIYIYYNIYYTSNLQEIYTKYNFKLIKL